MQPTRLHPLFDLLHVRILFKLFNRTDEYRHTRGAVYYRINERSVENEIFNPFLHHSAFGIKLNNRCRACLCALFIKSDKGRLVPN